MVQSPLKATRQVFVYFLIFAILTSISYSFTLSWNKAYIICHVLFLLFFLKRHKEDLLEKGKEVKKDLSSWKKFIPLTFVFLTISLLSNILLIHFLGTISVNEQLLRNDIFASPLLFAIITCFLGPIVEELIFRFPYYKVKKTPFTLFLMAIFFSFIHLPFSNNLLSYLFLIPYFFLSLFISYPFYKTDNIYLSIGIHILYNTFNFVLLLI